MSNNIKTISKRYQNNIKTIQLSICNPTLLFVDGILVFVMTAIHLSTGDSTHSLVFMEDLKITLHIEPVKVRIDVRYNTNVYKIDVRYITHVY